MSSPHQRDRRKSRLLPLLFWGGVAFYALSWTGPRLLYGSQINGYAALAYFILISSVMAILSDFFWFLGNHFDEKAALTPSGNKGSSDFVRSRQEIAHELVESGWAPYGGTFKGEALKVDYGSVALTCGTSGSGKGVSKEQIHILCVRESKIIIDLKSDLTCILANALRERGEIVHVLNMGDVNEEIIGPSAYYNPLNLIADNYWRPDGLHDVTADVLKFCTQLVQEPASAGAQGNDNSFFRISARDIAGFAIQMCVLTDGNKATLGDVVQLLNDRESLLRHAQWACGRLEHLD